MKASLGLLAVLSLTAIGCAKRTSVVDAQAGVDMPLPALATRERVELELASYKRQVENDPEGALGWSFLAGAHLARARLYDSYEDAQAAEAGARKSLGIRKTGNVIASLRLTQALLNQHRFQDALASAREGVKIANHSPDAQRMLIECLLEVGQYEEAKSLFVKNSNNMPTPERTLLRSRFLELFGRTRDAVLDVERLRLKAESDGEPAAYRSLLYQRLGELYWSMAQIERAENAYDMALSLEPDSWRSMLGRCRVYAANKEWSELLKLGHQAEELVQMTELVGLLGDAYKGIGDSAMAVEHYREAAELAGYAQQRHSHSHGAHHSHEQAHGHPLDRQYARFAADHGVDLGNALKAALKDLGERKDIHAYDTLAWIRFKREEYKLARAAIEKACRTGTRDHVILEHRQQILRL
jgi:tetratricopeptide (TPR) repeat protein